MSTGVDPRRRRWTRSKSLSAPPGRLELVGHGRNGALVYVDYAHKPDALESVLQFRAPFTTGASSPWSSAAAATATRASGRSWARSRRACRRRHRHRRQSALRRAGGIRAAIMAAPRGRHRDRRPRRGDPQRRPMLQSGDTLIVAGKGHEEGQTVGGVDAAVLRPRGLRKALWRMLDHEMALDPLISSPRRCRAAPSATCRRASPAFPSTAARCGRAKRSSPSRATASTAMTSQASPSPGAALLVVSEGKLPALGRLVTPMIVVPTCSKRSSRSRLGSRARTYGAHRRRHRQRRQDRHQGDAAPRRSAVDGSVHAFRRLFQQPLGRAADARPHAGDRRATASSRSA
jgi:hypothetical protein